MLSLGLFVGVKCCRSENCYSLWNRRLSLDFRSDIMSHFIDNIKNVVENQSSDLTLFNFFREFFSLREKHFRRNEHEILSGERAAVQIPNDSAGWTSDSQTDNWS